MDSYIADATASTRKCAKVPPVVIHSPSPSSGGHATCILPPISPQTSLLSVGAPCYSQRPSPNQLYVSTEQHRQVKQETFFQTTGSCQYDQHQGSTIAPRSNIQLANQCHISPFAPGINQLQSPLLFDLSPPTLTKPRIGHYDVNNPRLTAKRGKMKMEGGIGTCKLPPLSSGSNLDIDETISCLVPPIKSLSPYIGSGISEVPSFPSILSPINSRKRALSTSSLSDVLDMHAFQSSPNSLMATLYNNPSTPQMGNNCTVGHLIGQSNPPVQAMQYRVQQRKTCIEHNQNNDGTTNMTITNQVTFSKKPHTDLKMDPGSELMDTLGSISRDEEVNDPHICLWDGCGLNFEDLEDLVQHIESTHIEKGKADEYVCLWQSCIRSRKPFNARYKLLIHMRIHSGEKPNKCTYLGCSKAFSRLENLKIHLRTHTGEKPYICQFNGCLKSFSNSSDRSKHQKTHFDRKPYACTFPDCNKRYTDPSSLRKHIKMHNRIKKPRSDTSHEDDLDRCLTVQAVPLRLPLGSSSATKQKAISAMNSTLGKRNFLAHEEQQQQFGLSHCFMDGHISGDHYMALSSNGSADPPMVASPMSVTEQHSSSVLSPKTTCHYGHSSKQLVMYAPSAPTNELHITDPASPVKSTNTYSHMGFPTQRAYTMEPTPYYPPPNYTEATSVTRDVHYPGHFMIKCEYMPQQASNHNQMT